MKRRRFLGSAAMALVAASWPGWLRRAFADATVVDRTRGSREIGVAWERARRLGRPLLVLVVPNDDAEKWERGTALGAWLNYGDDAQVAALAMCEVVCAKMADLPSGWPVGSGEPWMILVEESGGAVVARPLDAAVPIRRDGLGRVAGEPTEDELVDRRIAILASLARGPLLDDRRAVARRASRAAEPGPVASTGARTSEAIAAALGGRDEAAAGRASRVLDQLALGLGLASSPEQERAIVERMAGVAKRRWREAPPPGSHWAHASSCGPDEIEGVPPDEDRAAIACGMGHVPAKSERFLYLLTVAAKRGR